MQKRAFYILRASIASASLAAMSVVFGKYLAIGVGEYLRFSFENLPILFAGMAFGPLFGALVGAVADLVGCMLVGYTINPIITIGAAAIGLISGIYRFLPKRQGGVLRFLMLLAAVFIPHAIGSVIIKTVGLSAFYSIPLSLLMLWRLLNYLMVGTLEFLILYYLFTSKAILREINRIYPRLEKSK